MIVSYQQINPDDRDRIRSIESKPHIGYIRYMLCRRVSFYDIQRELMKMGFSPIDSEDLYFYFKQVMFPIFKKYQLQRYYYHYKINREIELLSFRDTFQHHEEDRLAFCKCIQLFEIDFFFAHEIFSYYQNSLPQDPETGELIIKSERVESWSDILQHPKRHIIEMMLAEGKTSKQIALYLEKTFGIELSFKEIQYYANAFFKIRRKDFERTIEDLQEEKELLEKSLEQIRQNQNYVSVSERNVALGETKKKIADLDAIIRRMQGHHSFHAYHAGVLEYANIREIFADVMLRTHKRFVDIDETQPETDAVNYLSVVVGMMSKATEKIIAVDDKLKEQTRKSVSDEMLEVILPTMERLNQEEEAAFNAYKKNIGAEKEDEILGFEE